MERAYILGLIKLSFSVVICTLQGLEDKIGPFISLLSSFNEEK